MGPQRPNLTNLDPVFCKKWVSIWIRGKTFFFGTPIHFFGRQNWPFFRVSVKMSEKGAECKKRGQQRNCNEIPHKQWSMTIKIVMLLSKVNENCLCSAGINLWIWFQWLPSQKPFDWAWWGSWESFTWHPVASGSEFSVTMEKHKEAQYQENLKITARFSNRDLHLLGLECTWNRKDIKNRGENSQICSIGGNLK